MRSSMSEKVVLLVEDNSSDEALARRALGKHGFSGALVVARDGAEALDYLFDTDGSAGDEVKPLPQLILLDLKLPKLSGIDVLCRLRAEQRTRSIPVVIWTSSAEEEDLLAGYCGGCNSYLRKPVDFVQFSEALGKVAAYWLDLNLPPPHKLEPLAS